MWKLLRRNAQQETGYLYIDRNSTACRGSYATSSVIVSDLDDKL